MLGISRLHSEGVQPDYEELLEIRHFSKEDLPFFGDNLCLMATNPHNKNQIDVATFWLFYYEEYF